MHLSINSEAAWQAAPRFAVTGSDCAWNPTTTRCGCRHGLSGFGLLGQISAEAAYEAAKAAETNLNPADYVSNPSFAASRMAGFIRNMDVSFWANYSTNCHGQAPNLSLFQTASGMALGIGGATTGVLAATHVISAAAGAIAGAALIGVGAVISIFSIIHAHHAAAVRRDDAAQCALYPAIANTLKIAHDGVKNGTLTPQQGIAMLQALPGQFVTVAGPAYNHAPFCNALCEAKILLDAFCRYWIGQFEAMPTKVGTPAGSTGTVVPMNTAPAGSSQATTGTPASLTTTQPTAGTAVDMATGQPLPAHAPSAIPSWLPVAAVVAAIVVLMGK